MTFLQIRYAAGVGAPLHTHSHESIAYVVSGKVKSTVGSTTFIMGPGDVCRHPKGVLHGLEAIEDSLVVEIKAPAPDLAAFFGMRPSAPTGADPRGPQSCAVSASPAAPWRAPWPPARAGRPWRAMAGGCQMI